MAFNIFSILKNCNVVELSHSLTHFSSQQAIDGNCCNYLCDKFFNLFIYLGFHVAFNILLKYELNFNDANKKVKITLTKDNCKTGSTSIHQ